MIVDGKKLAEEIKLSLKKEVLDLGKKIRLAIVKVGSDAVTEKFLSRKNKFAKDVGVDVKVYEFPEQISTNQLRKEISKAVHAEKNSGIIVQLPLPKHINTDYILDALPPNKDPDVLSSKSVGLFVSGRSKILPPVVGAVNHILATYSVQLTAKNTVVVGSGRLVGKPVAIWLVNQGATASVLNSKSRDISYFTKKADIVVSGVGKPAIITTDMVSDGVVAIDCGIAESNGMLVGDFDLGVAKQASLFTPVPGGVGPLAVAMLFSNLVELAKTK